MPEFDSTISYRDVEGFPGYKVGSDGSVWSCWKQVGHGYGGGTYSVLGSTWHQLKPGVARGGYLNVTLCPGRHTRLIHHLVLEAFVGPRPAGMDACHDPSPDRADNRLSNLRWDTKRANQADSARHGTRICGDRHPLAKITDHQAQALRDEYRMLRGDRGKIPNGLLAMLAGKHGISTTQAKRIARGERFGLT